MPTTLRHLARSRGLRVLGLLAWMMLAFGASVAAPSCVAGPQHVVMQGTMVANAAIAAHGHGHPPAGQGHACCDMHAHGGTVPDHGHGHGCGCAGPGVSALPVPSEGLLASTPAATTHASPGQLQAPAPDTAPPLRPPAT